MGKNVIVELNQQKHVQNEKKIMTLLDNPFCVRLRDTLSDKLNVYFLMDPIMGGELFSLLRHQKTFKQRTTAFYAGNVVLALEYLHESLNVIYRDIKPENLMICRNGYLKLVDFGFAKKKLFEVDKNTFCGTPAYIAPEVIKNIESSFSIDWWAL